MHKLQAASATNTLSSLNTEPHVYHKGARNHRGPTNPSHGAGLRWPACFGSGHLWRPGDERGTKRWAVPGVLDGTAAYCNRRLLCAFLLGGLEHLYVGRSLSLSLASPWLAG